MSANRGFRPALGAENGDGMKRYLVHHRFDQHQLTKHRGGSTTIIGATKARLNNTAIGLTHAAPNPPPKTEPSREEEAGQNGTADTHQEELRDSGSMQTSPAPDTRKRSAMHGYARHSFTATPNALNSAQEGEEKIHPRDGSFPKSGTVH